MYVYVVRKMYPPRMLSLVQLSFSTCVSFRIVEYDSKTKERRYSTCHYYIDETCGSGAVALRFR